MGGKLGNGVTTSFSLGGFSIDIPQVFYKTIFVFASKKGLQFLLLKKMLLGFHQIYQKLHKLLSIEVFTIYSLV